jgi:hypothetical protein
MVIQAVGHSWVGHDRAQARRVSGCGDTHPAHRSVGESGRERSPARLPHRASWRARAALVLSARQPHARPRRDPAARPFPGRAGQLRQSRLRQRMAAHRRPPRWGFDRPQLRSHGSSYKANEAISTGDAGLRRPPPDGPTTEGGRG